MGAVMRSFRLAPMEQTARPCEMTHLEDILEEAFRKSYDAALATLEVDTGASDDPEFQRRLAAYRASLEHFGWQLHRHINAVHKRVSRARSLTKQEPVAK